MIDDQEYRTLGKLYGVLGQLPPHFRRAVQEDGQQVSAPAGHLLFDVDSQCAAFLLLAAGTIRVIKPARSGRELVLYRLGPGDSCILTVSCLLGHAKYPAQGVVEVDLKAYAVSQPMFDELLDESAAFRRFVFQFFSARITQLMELVEEVTFGQLDQRLAVLLLDLGPTVTATHQMLADELGTVREVVSRILKGFEGLELVRLERGQIQVLDSAGLAEVALPVRDMRH